MTQFQYLDGGNLEHQDKLADAYLFEQSAEGIARTGVISGLGVAQTTTAGPNVVVGAGSGVVQVSRLAGAERLVNDTDFTLDVLTANPMGGVPRNDIVVFDQATLPNGIRVIVGTPAATPSDPTVPTSAIPLARLRHAASATTVSSGKIDDLRATARLKGTSKTGGRFHWGKATAGPTDASGYATITHGCGFTPDVVVASNQSGYQMAADNPTATTFRVRVLQADGSVYSGVSLTVNYFCGE